VAEFNRVLQTTIAEYMLGAEDNVIRNRKLLAMLKAKGRITFNHSGTKPNWGVLFKQRDIEGYQDGDTVTFARSDNYKRAELPDWRGYTMRDFVTKKEKLMNRGKPALIKYVSEMVEQMSTDYGDRFHAQLYVDGYATGNEKKIHGFDSFTGASVSAGAFIATPNDSYAGLTTNLGTYGGTWSGTWPRGVGDSEYDFWAPTIVDYTNTGWSAATKTWPNTCQEAMRFGIIKAKKNDSKKGMLDLILLDGELFRQWETTLDSTARVIVDKGAGPATLRNLGFGDTVWFEGVEVSWEFGVPADANGVEQGYGFNVDEMELMSLQDRLFVPDGPFYDEASLADRFMITMFGNMKFNPRYFAKWAKYS
jgi:hypothetical protein